MVLVDTSVWINHLRRNDSALVTHLNDNDVCCHPFVVGELACGHLTDRSEILDLLSWLPPITRADDFEVLTLIDHLQLMGRGFGFIDLHLLASALLDGVPLWTADRRLDAVAAERSIAYRP